MTTLWILAWASAAAAYAGGLYLLMGRNLSRERLENVALFRAGILLAVSFTEVFPEAWRSGPMLAGWGALGAFIILFTASRMTLWDICPEYIEHCGTHHVGPVMFAALTAHSVIDGINLAAAFAAGSRAGLAVGAAVILHKFADGFALASVLITSGWERGRRAALLLMALGTPLGDFAGRLGLLRGGAVEALLLGFAAGSFVYLAASDLVPYVHRREPRSGLLYFGLGLGAMLAFGALH